MTLYITLHNVGSSGKFDTSITNFKKMYVLLLFLRRYFNIQFVFSFDDARYSVRHLISFLLKRNETVHLFIISNYLHEKTCDKDFLNINHIKYFYNNGLILGCHSFSHYELSSLSYDRLHQEIVVSKNIIENLFECKINYFAYPNGVFNHHVKNMVANNYLAAFSVSNSYNCIHTIKRFDISNFQFSNKFKFLIKLTKYAFSNFSCNYKL